MWLQYTSVMPELVGQGGRWRRGISGSLDLGHLRQATNIDPVSNKREGEAAVVVQPEHQYGGMSASVRTQVCAPHTPTSRATPGHLPSWYASLTSPHVTGTLPPAYHQALFCTLCSIWNPFIGASSLCPDDLRTEGSDFCLQINKETSQTAVWIFFSTREPDKIPREEPLRLKRRIHQTEKESKDKRQSEVVHPGRTGTPWFSRLEFPPCLPQEHQPAEMPFLSNPQVVLPGPRKL